MKIRTNFVSNSSSSSFICFVKEDAFNKVLENWEPPVKVCENLFDDYEVELKSPKTRFIELKDQFLIHSNIFGTPVVVYDYMDEHGCYWDNEENAITFDELFADLLNEVPKEDKWSTSIGD